MINRGGHYDSYQVSTVFIGGGTPSILESEQITELMKTLYQSFHIEENAEITMEINPGTVTFSKLRAIKEGGVNRLSIGLQSTQNDELKALGRIHTYEEFVESYTMIRQSGFSNVNIDLMSALPEQTSKSYEETLHRVMALEPEHISAYSLIVEEGTPFGDAGDALLDLLPDEEEERKMYERTKEILLEKGYERYEISNYAKPGFYSRHNDSYWTRKNYLGLGLGASSLIENHRFTNTSDMESYLKVSKMMPFEEWFYRNSEEILTLDAQMEEFMFLGLRRMQGIDAEVFYKQFHKDIASVYGAVLKEHLREGLIRKTPKGYALTDQGIDLSNYVMSAYLF